jgi:LemA protein
MKHEQETLVRVVELRNYLKNPSLSDVEKTNANNELSREIPSLLAVAESYPELKADNQFLQLQKTITYLEDNLAASRRTFNAMINQYNAYIETFPALLFAKLFGFTRKQYFVSKDEERQNVHPTF